jgi:LacI family transcriptional regulator
MLPSTKKKVLLFVETSRSFGRQIIQGVSQFVTEHRDWKIIFQDRGVHEKLPDWMKHWDGDGVISRTDDAQTFRQLKHLKIPVVEVLGDGKRYPPLVKCDETSICRQVADHFWERGFRSFAFFSMGSNWWSQERFEAFQKSLQMYGVQCELAPTANLKNDITLSVLWWKGCEEDVFQWLRTLPKPVGIFCPCDMQAFFLMNICKDHGIAIPEYVAVVGYGNNADLCRVSTPPLSSVAPNARAIGYQAAVLLDLMFQNKPLPELPIYVPATHIETRLSSDVIAVNNSSVAAAIHFIRERLNQGQLSVTDIAKHLNLSKSTLTRLFRKWLGHSPKAEIQREQTALAEELLRETCFTVAQISAKLGYSSSANFVRAFRKQMHTTPEEYRYRCKTD